MGPTPTSCDESVSRAAGVNEGTGLTILMPPRLGGGATSGGVGQRSITPLSTSPTVSDWPATPVLTVRAEDEPPRR